MKKIPKVVYAVWACHNKNYNVGQDWSDLLMGKAKNFISFDPQEEMNRYGKDEMNKKFLQLVQREKPNFVFMWLVYDEFYIETLIKIRESLQNTKLINFFGDDDTLFDSFSRYYARLFDYVLVFQKNYISKYKKDRVQNVFPICGVNIKKLKPLKLTKKYDVTFIGTPKRDRYSYIRFLMRNGIKIKIFGQGWEFYDDLKEVYGGQCSKEDYIKIINQTKINLSFSKNYEGKLQFKGRIFEIFACKSFTLTEYFEGYSVFFKENKEIVLFRDKDDLLKKIKYYLKDEHKRERIAERAYKKIITKYSQEKEYKTIFKSSTLKEKSKNNLPKLNLRVVNLDEREIDNLNKLQRKLKNCEYVSFVGDDSRALPFKTYFQAYSLEKTKKDISCCDYYVYSKKLGNFMTFQAKSAFNSLTKNEFVKLINPTQLMVKRDFFIANLEKFRALFRRENVDLISEKNVAFVSIPLVSVRKIPEGDYNSICMVFLINIKTKLSNLVYRKKILTDKYIYYLFLMSLLSDNRFIARYLIELLFNKQNLNKLFSFYRLN